MILTLIEPSRPAMDEKGNSKIHWEKNVFVFKAGLSAFSFEVSKKKLKNLTCGLMAKPAFSPGSAMDTNSVGSVNRDPDLGTLK
jgi:hypothetical protein